MRFCEKFTSVIEWVCVCTSAGVCLCKCVECLSHDKEGGLKHLIWWFYFNDGQQIYNIIIRKKRITHKSRVTNNYTVVCLWVCVCVTVRSAVSQWAGHCTSRRRRRVKHREWVQQFVEMWNKLPSINDNNDDSVVADATTATNKRS